MINHPGIFFRRGPGSRAGRCLSGFAKARRGSLLLETVIALVTFVLVGTAVLHGVSTTLLSGANTENQSVADNLARNQLEAIAAQPFQANAANYSVISLPEGYQVAITSEPLLTEDPNQIHKLIVTVSDALGAEILRLETIKSNL